MTPEHEEQIRDCLSIDWSHLVALMLHKMHKSQMTITLEDIEDYAMQFPTHHLTVQLYPKLKQIHLLVLKQEDVHLVLDPMEGLPS